MVISFVTFLYLIYCTNILIEDKNLIFILCFTFSTISPIATFYFLKKNNLISDLDASKKEERLLPMAFGALFFLLGFITLKMLNAQLLVQGIMFCGMINVILAWLITNYWKISIHAITLSSSITIFWMLGYQKGIDDNSNIIIGVNQFIDESSESEHTFQINTKSVDEQIDSLHLYKKNRSKIDFNEKLNMLKKTAASNENIMPAILECVKNQCTLGEISDTLREVFGNHE